MLSDKGTRPIVCGPTVMHRLCRVARLAHSRAAFLEGEFGKLRRVRNIEQIHADIGLLTATNRDLDQMSIQHLTARHDGNRTDLMAMTQYFANLKRPYPPAAPSAATPQLLTRSSTLVTWGNPTLEDGAPASAVPGGTTCASQRPAETPFGTVYPHKLTPDIATGLGKWWPLASPAPRQIQGWKPVEPGFTRRQQQHGHPCRCRSHLCLPAKPDTDKTAQPCSSHALAIWHPNCTFHLMHPLLPSPGVPS